MRTKQTLNHLKEIGSIFALTNKSKGRVSLFFDGFTSGKRIINCMIGRKIICTIHFKSSLSVSHFWKKFFSSSFFSRFLKIQSSLTGSQEYKTVITSVKIIEHVSNSSLFSIERLTMIKNSGNKR